MSFDLIPSYLLSSIFSFVPRALCLRLVCHEFDRIFQETFSTPESPSLASPSSSASASGHPISNSQTPHTHTCKSDSIGDLCSRFTQLPWIRSFKLCPADVAGRLHEQWLFRFFSELESEFLAHLPPTQDPFTRIELMLFIPRRRINATEAVVLLTYCKSLSERYNVFISVDFVELRVCNIWTLEEHHAFTHSPLFLHVNAWNMCEFLFRECGPDESMFEPAIIQFCSSPNIKNLQHLAFLATRFSPASVLALKECRYLSPSSVDFIEVDPSHLHSLISGSSTPKYPHLPLSSPTYPSFLHNVRKISVSFEREAAQQGHVFYRLVIRNPFAKKLESLAIQSCSPLIESDDDENGDDDDDDDSEEEDLDFERRFGWEVGSMFPTSPMLSNIVELELTDCSYVTTDAIRAIGSDQSCITHLESLQITVVYTQIERSLLEIIATHRNFSRLKKLVIFSSKTTESDVVAFARNARLMQLQQLSFRSKDMTNVSSYELFSSSATSYPLLAELRLSVDTADAIKMLQDSPTPPKYLKKLTLPSTGPGQHDPIIPIVHQVQEWNPPFSVVYDRY